MEVTLNFISLFCFSLATLYCIYSYVMSTYIDKTRENNYVDTWLCLLVTAKFIEIALSFYLNLASHGNLLSLPIERNPAFRILYYSVKILFVFFCFMMFLKAPRKIIYIKINKTFTLISVLYNMMTPVLLMFYFSFRNPSITEYVITSPYVDDIIYFPIIENIIRIGFSLFAVMTFVLFILIRSAKYVLFKQETLLLFFTCVIILLLNFVSEQGYPLFVVHGLYSLYNFLQAYLLVMISVFIRFDGLKSRYQVQVL
jgi:hypothetical protein